MGLHIMKAPQIVRGLQERRMRVIKSQLHTYMTVTPRNLIDPLLHYLRLFVEQNPWDLRQAVVHIHHSQKLAPVLECSISNRGPIFPFFAKPIIILMNFKF